MRYAFYSGRKFFIILDNVNEALTESLKGRIHSFSVNLPFNYISKNNEGSLGEETLRYD